MFSIAAYSIGVFIVFLSTVALHLPIKENSGFEVDYSGKHFAINDEEYLHVDIDDSRFIEVNNNSAKYSDNGTELIIGGDDNFLELKNGTKSVALTQDEKLSFVDGNYAATLSKELEIEMTDGERTIGLFTPQNNSTLIILHCCC